MSRRSCVNSPDKFCYICGQYTCEKQRLNINDFVTTAYFNYFGRKIENQDKNWVPHKVCQSCAQFLRLWDTGKIKNLPSCITYRYSSSSTEVEFDNENSREEELHDNDNNEVDNFEDDDGSPKLLSQSSLNDLVRELDLPKDKAELLGSRLKERNLLQPDVTFCWYRNREEKFIEFFTDKDSMSYCNNVQGLIEQFGIKYDPKQWRFFIDSSQKSLKGVLLNNGNKYASIPIFHSVHLKENYTNMKTVFECVQYKKHQWKLCGDLKVICMVLGQQAGYTKFPCFICH
ncbi:hypothetical protein ALC57_11193 [Trachymyrmex cornetzi]|uniref:Uncharacterized protein n=1 Tax=Trachymyrmex cornetzi TaxID=471704 RepID=A0A151J2V7_9HYME|nr:hypothetical protein ALC57_11193 [Trachymyrmex cornetzi]